MRRKPGHWVERPALGTQQHALHNRSHYRAVLCNDKKRATKQWACDCPWLTPTQLVGQAICPLKKKKESRKMRKRDVRQRHSNSMWHVTIKLLPSVKLTKQHTDFNTCMQASLAQNMQPVHPHLLSMFRPWLPRTIKHGFSVFAVSRMLSAGSPLTLRVFQSHFTGGWEVQTQGCRHPS